jgi:hypothetical protein
MSLILLKRLREKEAKIMPIACIYLIEYIQYFKTGVQGKFEILGNYCAAPAGDV